jgi:hypothetical protein
MAADEDLIGRKGRDHQALLIFIARRRERSKASGPDYGLCNKPFLIWLQVPDFAFDVIGILIEIRAGDHHRADRRRRRLRGSTLRDGKARLS